MIFAYADPPYLNQGAKDYSNKHPDAGVWDGAEGVRTTQLLISRLIAEYPDGWALSLSTPSLRIILPMCPDDCRIAAWVKPFHVFKKGVRPAYAWEPVIFRGGRNKHHPPPEKGGEATTPKDFLSEPITLRKGLVGTKPPRFCRWILDLLNYQEGDELVDIFPGTGIMNRVLAQGRMVI